PPIPHKIRNKI
ncbi:family 25 glycosyl transferase, partial [Helicobacter pylori]